MPAYDLHQQTFVLSMAVNFAFNHEGTATEVERYLDKTLSDLLAQADIQDLIGDWSLVWGTAVWEFPIISNHSDNTMAVFHNAADNVYVCAIAATNANSGIDWVAEDLWVGKRVPWEYQPPVANAVISQATDVGLKVLLGLPDPATLTSVTDFLRSVANTGATLIFTGHSLAGALSPTLALALYGSAKARASWKQVLVYPTAGATPGNKVFADAFAGQFPEPEAGPEPWQKWNTLLWNRRDVIPHAWGKDTLNQVPKLYDMKEDMRWVLEKLFEFAAELANPSGEESVWYSALNNFALDGTPKRPSIIKNWDQYAKEMTWQHVNSYFQLIGVPELEAYYEKACAPTVVAADKPLPGTSPDDADAPLFSVVKALGKNGNIKGAALEKLVKAFAEPVA